MSWKLRCTGAMVNAQVPRHLTTQRLYKHDHSRRNPMTPTTQPKFDPGAHVLPHRAPFHSQHWVKGFMPANCFL